MLRNSSIMDKIHNLSKNPALEKNGCYRILPSWKKSTISQTIQPWRKMVVAEFFHRGQYPRSLKKFRLGEKWLLQNSFIMDKIHDHSKFPRARELEIMEEKMLVLEVSPSWKKNWVSVGNSSFMEE